MTTQSYKAGYEAGWYGHKPMTKAQYSAGLKALEADWKQYRLGIKNGQEDKRAGYEYNDD
jgi:hypothetical protein